MAKAYYRSSRIRGRNSRRVRRGLYSVKYNPRNWVRYIRSRQRGSHKALTREQRQELYNKLIWSRKLPRSLVREIMDFAGKWS